MYAAARSPEVKMSESKVQLHMVNVKYNYFRLHALLQMRVNHILTHTLQYHYCTAIMYTTQILRSVNWDGLDMWNVQTGSNAEGWNTLHLGKIWCDPVNEDTNKSGLSYSMHGFWINWEGKLMAHQGSLGKWLWMAWWNVKVWPVYVGSLMYSTSYNVWQQLTTCWCDRVIKHVLYHPITPACCQL